MFRWEEPDDTARSRRLPSTFWACPRRGEQAGSGAFCRIATAGKPQRSCER